MGEVFQDLPLLDKSTRLTVMELEHCDKQIVNELVYRWCRILTRLPKKSSETASAPTDTAVQDLRKVLIIDLIGAVSAVRLATILKRDEGRLRVIGITRGCRINSTYVTITSYLGREAKIPSALKLVVIYQDEFFIFKTLDILKDVLHSTKCQILFVVPRLDRRDRDVLNLTSNNQILRCDFSVNRRDMSRADQSQLNHVYFQRYHPKRDERILGELKDDGLHLNTGVTANKI